VWDPPLNLGEGAELWGRVWYPVKVHQGVHNLSIETETRSVYVYEPITVHILLGGTVPQFGEGVDLGDLVCYPLNVLCSSYNLFAGTETLSLSVYEPIAMQFLLGGRPPIFGRGLS
jgi:hypothetical protein